MIYLIDANTLITAHNTWYGFDRVPEFWRWLLYHGQAGRVKMPAEIYAEVQGGNDVLALWMSESTTKDALLLVEDTNPAAMTHVLNLYGSQLTEDDLITIGQDPFLIAAGLGHIDRTVVTAEVSKPTRTGSRRHVPDVCSDCQVRWISPVAFISELDFTTGWETK
jgi:Domain of unknown function (DUF4411)